MTDNKKHLRGYKFIVTGHTGFKGTWLSLLLEQLGAEVVGISDVFRPTSLYARLREYRPIEEYFIDIRNYKELENKIQTINPDGIFHLAAQPLVIESYINPLETFETNIVGTANVIVAAYKAEKIKFLVAVTTDKVYENENTGVPFIESDRLGGHDPYSASKAAAEMVINSLRGLPDQSIDFPIISARAGNVIGGGDDANNRLLPDLIHAMKHQEILEVRNPTSTRPWQHVLEPLLGYIKVALSVLSSSKISLSYNFGPDKKSSLTVEKVCSLASEMWGAELILKIKSPDDLKYTEAKLLSLDSTKANQELNWSTNFSAEMAVGKTIGWEKKVLENPNLIYEITVTQIKDYIDLVM
jgi:CDP-glucose 4,6-dehydratase